MSNLDFRQNLFVHQKRGKEALESEQSIIKDFTKWAVHDCWESYFRFEGGRHILCNAHRLRELESLKEQGSNWAKKMQDFIFEMYEVSEKGQKVIAKRAAWEARYEKICGLGEKEEPPPEKGKRGKPKNSRGRNLLNRLKKHQAGIMEYAFTAEVPFTNNQAERDIRCVKIKQKISNSFRSQKGAAHYARIQGFVSTVRKHKIEEINSGTGGRTTAQGYGGQDNIRQKFTSYERDNETDLDYAKARYYNKNLGRFTSTDPVLITSYRLLNPQAINLYAYVANSPLKFTDPTGKDIRFKTQADADNNTFTKIFEK
jgi:transposase